MTLLLDHLATFQTVNLESVDQGWLGKRRFDRKFLLSRNQLSEFLERNETNFSVLEIDGLNSFGYRTDYFDTAKLDCYFDHVQGRKRRAKIRFRKYLDSNHIRFEVKMKLGNLQSHKAALENAAGFTEVESEFVAQVLGEFIPNSRVASLVHELSPVATNTFQRSTLVHKSALERITVDQSLAVLVDEKQKRLNEDLVLLEVKSVHRNSRVVRELLLNGIRPVRFSKYCAAIDLLVSERPLVHTRRFLSQKFSD